MPKLTRLPSKISTIDTSSGASITTKRTTGSRLMKTNKRIAIRDGYTCQKCGNVVAKFEIDHIVPLFLGGSDADENKQLLCIPCHDEKSAEEESERQGRGKR